MTTKSTSRRAGSIARATSPPTPEPFSSVPRENADRSGGNELDVLDLLFKGFADPTRVRILSVLAAGDLCVSDIVAILDLPQPFVSRHLAYLRRTGLVAASREGKFARYRLAKPASPVHESLVSCVRSCMVGVPLLDRERAQAEARAVKRTVGEAGEPC